jgi:hypothetical protein
VSFVAITISVASQWVFVVVVVAAAAASAVYFVIDSVQKLLVTPSYQIPDYYYGDQDGPGKFGFIQAPDEADSPRRLHRN